MLRSSLVVAALLGLGCTDGGPTILDVRPLANTTSEIGPYGVWATVIDDHEVRRVEIHYVTDAGFTIVMTRLEGDVWYGEIPGQVVGTKVSWCVAASDGRAGGVVTFPADCDKAPLTFAVVAP